MCISQHDRKVIYIIKMVDMRGISLAANVFDCFLHGYSLPPPSEVEDVMRPRSEGKTTL